jgi:hypothetical protein
MSATRKRQITKISADIARIENSFFRTDETDRDPNLRYHALDRERQQRQQQ